MGRGTSDTASYEFSILPWRWRNHFRPAIGILPVGFLAADSIHSTPEKEDSLPLAGEFDRIRGVPAGIVLDFDIRSPAITFGDARPIVLGPGHPSVGNNLDRPFLFPVSNLDEQK